MDYNIHLTYEELLVEIAQGLSACNQELEYKKEEFKDVKKFGISKMMKITQECAEINERKEKLIKDFICLMLE